MKLNELLFLAGLVLLVISGFLLSTLQKKQIKNIWDMIFRFRTRLGEFDPADIRLAKVAMILFIGGLLLFVIGSLA